MDSGYGNRLGRGRRARLGQRSGQGTGMVEAGWDAGFTAKGVATDVGSGSMEGCAAVGAGMGPGNMGSVEGGTPWCLAGRARECRRMAQTRQRGRGVCQRWRARGSVPGKPVEEA